MDLKLKLVLSFLLISLISVQVGKLVLTRVKENESLVYKSVVLKVPPFRKIDIDKSAVLKVPSSSVFNFEESCFSDELFITLKDGRKVFNLLKVGKYALMGKNVSKSYRYNHFCPWMRPRYNCARSSTMYGEDAADWKLVLQANIPNITSTTCNLWEFINDLGGPSGVGQKMIQDATNPHSTQARQDKRAVNVLVLGNSFMRQMLQALKCGWSHDITLSLMQKGASYNSDIASIKATKGKIYISLNQTGDMERMPLMWEQPCKVEKQPQYYRSGVEVPLQCSFQSLYDDRISLVEFGKTIRFHFIYYPNRFRLDDLETIMKDKLLLTKSKVDMLIYNQALYIDLFKKLVPEQVWFRKSEFRLGGLKRLQNKELGKWFGADNPWIYQAPDMHSCMPGPVDDLVNMFLYIAYSGASLTYNV